MRTKTRWLSVGAAAALAGSSLVSCISPVDVDGSKVPARCSAEAPLAGPQKTDILFVIDDSGSMKEEQEGLAQELPAFIDALKQGGGAGHDFQVGVITTSVYQHAIVNGQADYREFPEESGRLRAVPLVAPGGGTEPGFERVLLSSDPELVEKFARLVQQGTSGSGQETPFEAVRLAVTELTSVPQEQGGNAGFLRDGARLLVVVVSDEDDCSEMSRPPVVAVGTASDRDYCTEQAENLTPVAEYAELFKGLKDSNGAQKQVLWAAIAPVSREGKEAEAVVVDGVVRNVDCPTSFQPGFRQREMASLFDTSLSNLDSVCRTSYRDTLLAIAQIANSAQTLDVSNVPDERLLKVEITRASGEVDTCTLANGGISYEPPNDLHEGRVFFTETCPRKPDDVAVSLKMLCAG